MSRHRTCLLIIALAIMAHVAVHEWCDVAAKRWVAKGKWGQFGYKQWDYDSVKDDRYGFAHNTTSLYLGPITVTVPLSAASLLMAQVTVPLIIWSLVRGRRRDRRKALQESAAGDVVALKR